MLRAVGLASGIGFLLATWWLTRLLAGSAAAFVALVVVAGIPEIQLQASRFLTDIPSAAVVLLMTAVVWRQCELRRPDARFVLVAPLAALAFYARFASALPAALLAATALAL